MKSLVSKGTVDYVGRRVKHETFVLWNELIKVKLAPWKEIKWLKFWRLALRQSDQTTLNTSAIISFLGENSSFLNSSDKPKFSCWSLNGKQRVPHVVTIQKARIVWWLYHFPSTVAGRIPFPGGFFEWVEVVLILWVFSCFFPKLWNDLLIQPSRVVWENRLMCKIPISR